MTKACKWGSATGKRAQHALFAITSMRPTNRKEWYGACQMLSCKLIFFMVYNSWHFNAWHSVNYFENSTCQFYIVFSPQLLLISGKVRHIRWHVKRSLYHTCSAGSSTNFVYNWNMQNNAFKSWLVRLPAKCTEKDLPLFSDCETHCASFLEHLNVSFFFEIRRCKRLLLVAQHTKQIFHFQFQWFSKWNHTGRKCGERKTISRRLTIPGYKFPAFAVFFLSVYCYIYCPTIHTNTTFSPSAFAKQICKRCIKIQTKAVKKRLHQT